MSIKVTNFKWEKGKNDLEYIELLENNLDVMLGKFRECSKVAREQYNKGYTKGRADERARVVDENKNAWGKVLNQLHKWKNNAENEHEQKIAYAYFSAIGIINQHLAEIEVKEQK